MVTRAGTAFLGPFPERHLVEAGPAVLALLEASRQYMKEWSIRLYLLELDPGKSVKASVNSKVGLEWKKNLKIFMCHLLGFCP